MVVAHSFSLSSQDTEAGRSLEFQASLVYIVTSKLAGTTQTLTQSWGGGQGPGAMAQCLRELSALSEVSLGSQHSHCGL